MLDSFFCLPAFSWTTKVFLIPWYWLADHITQAFVVMVFFTPFFRFTKAPLPITDSSKWTIWKEIRNLIDSNQSCTIFTRYVFLFLRKVFGTTKIILAGPFYTISRCVTFFKKRAIAIIRACKRFAYSVSKVYNILDK